MRVRGVKRLMAPMLLALWLAGCGGGGGGGSSNPPPVVVPEGRTANPLEQALGDAALTVTGLSEQDINNQTVPLQFDLATATWGSTPADVAVTVNGAPFDPTAMALTAGNAHQAQALVNLEDGFNDVLISGSDDSGRLLHVHKQVWAGRNKVTVRVQDASGADWAGGADITVTLADAPGISAQYALASGASKVQVKNLPSRTVLVEATSGKLAGVTGAVVDSSQEIVVKLQQAAADSALDAGPVQNQTLNTAGHIEPQLLHNTFTTAAGTQAVTVRYRFVTSEWTAGQFGSRTSNDYFSVRLRNAQGQQAVESLAMNGLGETAFDNTGATAVRTLRLATNPAGDTVRLDGVVGNTFDGKNDSQLVITQISEVRTLVQPQLTWDSVQGGLTITVNLQGEALADALPLKLYWASGTSATQVLGAAVKELSLPKGSNAGTALSFHVDGSQLGTAPALATHLIAVAGDSALALPDVQLLEGPNADASSLSATMRNALKASARQAGAATVSLAQTALTPAQFAHAMFLNLVRSSGTLDSNISTQQAMYGAEGKAVIQVFVAQSQGLTLDQVIAKQTDIEAALAAEITHQGPAKVSTQCSDPAQASVADVRVASVPAATANLFKTLLGSLAVSVSEASGLWHVTAAP